MRAYILILLIWTCTLFIESIMCSLHIALFSRTNDELDHSLVANMRLFMCSYWISVILWRITRVRVYRQLVLSSARVCVRVRACVCVYYVPYTLTVYQYDHYFYSTSFPQVRQQELLDTTAQKHKAYLSQGKGLQSRRLPSNLAEKVPEDYSARRRAQTYASSDLKRSTRSIPSLSPTREETDSGDSMSAMTDEERKQKVK